MKEATIISNFNKLFKQQDSMGRLVEQNLKQVYMMQAALQTTIESLVNMLIEKEVLKNGEFEEYIKKYHEKKIQQSNEKQMETQPTFESTAEVPTPEGEQ